MKSLLSLVFLLIFISSCNEGMQVTARPNPQDATSGTLGSVRSNNNLPPADTMHSVLDSLRSKKP